MPVKITPEQRIVESQARAWSSLAGILALLYLVLIVVVVAAAIWLLMRFVV